jgi:hypothetical protein
MRAKAAKAEERVTTPRTRRGGPRVVSSLEQGAESDFLKMAQGSDFHDATLTLFQDTYPPSDEVRREQREGERTGPSHTGQGKTATSGERGMAAAPSSDRTLGRARRVVCCGTHSEAP